MISTEIGSPVPGTEARVNPSAEQAALAVLGLEKGLKGIGSKLIQTLADFASAPLTPASPPLRQEEDPTQADIAAAKKAALRPDSPLIAWAKRLGPPVLAGTELIGLAIACAPQEVNKPTIFEPATPRPTATFEPGPTTAPTEAPKPTIEAVSNEQGLRDLNSIINLIQNPDPQLIAACNPQPHLLKQDQELIVYGDRELPDPNKYQEQKFTKPGLVDVKASLEQGDKTKASEQLATVWQRIGNPVGCFNASGKPETSIDKLDDVVWSQEQVNVLDPQRRFVPKTAKGWGVSKIKQEAVKQFLKLWYGLASANLK